MKLNSKHKTDDDVDDVNHKIYKKEQAADKDNFKIQCMLQHVSN